MVRTTRILFATIGYLFRPQTDPWPVLLIKPGAVCFPPPFRRKEKSNKRRTGIIALRRLIVCFMGESVLTIDLLSHASRSESQYNPLKIQELLLFERDFLFRILDP